MSDSASSDVENRGWSYRWLEHVDIWGEKYCTLEEVYCHKDGSPFLHTTGKVHHFYSQDEIQWFADRVAEASKKPILKESDFVYEKE